MADKRLIDANALEEDLKRQYDAVFGNARKKVKPEDYFIERHAAYFANVQKAERDGFFAYLKTRPTVDAVEVVRCRDCERRAKSADLEYTVLCRWLHNLEMPKDGFCSYGERKDGEGNG